MQCQKYLDVSDRLSGRYLWFGAASGVGFVIRPGEKLHECMITEDDARHTRDHGDYYIIYPDFPWYQHAETAGESVPDGLLQFRD